MRRAYTIYLLGEYDKVSRGRDVVTTLQQEGILSENFDQSKIDLQGEAPEVSRGNTYQYYNNVCPEVNLFDLAHSLLNGVASSCGEWDKLGTKSKFQNLKSTHYSDCPEFSKHIFDLKFNPKQKPVQKSTNKRRVSISKKLRFEIFERDSYTCQYCGRNKSDGIKLNLDHKIPISVGGTDSYSNLVTSCEDCNQGKSDKIIALDSK
ncbi:HNH endonuclease [uncultured Pontibacter sp.]|uniref:HNH endonuclease n=1 Tax=uncultured Pontibacter sp. TaxID=453356 RepID=UPI0026074278|nr:HNH endonuclease [uncultured Pontibacter sp.]